MVNEIVTNVLSQTNIPTYYLCHSNKTTPLQQVYSYTSANWEALTFNFILLTQSTLTKILMTWILIQIGTSFIRIYPKLIQQSIPSRMTKSKPHLPWITKIYILQRKRDKPTDDKTMKAFQKPKVRIVEIHTSQLHQKHHRGLFWDFIKKTEPFGIPVLISNNKMQTTIHDKTNALNVHFMSVFTK